jgi:SAM-dependent methyltransferase
MLYGTREPFDYVECARCGALQIEQIPRELASYYPEGYPNSGGMQRFGTSHGALISLPPWTGTMMGGPALPFALLNQLSALPEDEFARQLIERVTAFYLEPTGVTRESRVLDIGCGDGGFLRALATAGFSRLLGVDRFMATDGATAAGPVPIVKGTVDDAPGRWDLIVLHHSFEHMEDPAGVLAAVAERLEPDGVCLIRTPVVPNLARQRFGAHWVALDPPRHLFVHSPASIGALAVGAGLRVEQCVYDSTFFGFWASDLCQRGISLREAGMEAFVLTRWLAWERLAGVANRSRLGDQAAFYLKRADAPARAA